MSKFLPFKALRRSQDAASPQDSAPASPALENYRPATPGADSVASSPKPSLRNRVSGQFFRRKSSLNMDFTSGSNGVVEGPRQSSENPTTVASPGSPRTNGFKEHETIEEDPHPSSPTLADNSPIAKKRKSGTFWRRTSSLTLSQTVSNDRSKLRHVSAGPLSTTTEGPSVLQNGNGSHEKHRTSDPEFKDIPPLPQNGSSFDRRIINGNSIDNIERKTSNTSGKLRRKPSIPGSIVGRKISGRKQQQPMLTPPRSASPPPQLPPFVGGGDGLGLDDWMI